MSLDQLDPLLTGPKRLALLGVLSNSQNAEFAFLRSVLDLSDSDLSKQMSALTNAGYATADKTGRGRDRQTWFKITKDGKKALTNHVAALNSLVDDAPEAPAPSATARLD